MASRVQQDLEQINAILNNLKRTIDVARTSLEQAPRGLSTWVGDAQRLVTMQQQYNSLLREAQRLQGPSQSVLNRLQPASRGISGGYQGGPVHVPQPSPELQKYIDQIDSQKRASEQRSLNAIRRREQAEQRRQEIAERRAKEEKVIADARARVERDPRYRNALIQAQGMGLTSQNLQSIEERGGGVQQLLFTGQRGGVNQRFRTYVNESGGATPGVSSQFRSFGKDIVRDIGQFTKWSIAIAAVYTPLQKLGELITIMIDNESRLADATIAANVPFEKAGEIFDASAEAANRAGESINTTIDAYAQAIRAVGRYNDEAQKAQIATTLLNDSLTLSKLSALDQATAIDTLSAALLQSDRELDQGQELLNKWVRISQVANVSIDTLATGVAVLGDSAETVGLSIDQLNGLIAVLAEQSISGSKEAANTAKALVGAYQSDKAEAALNKYGVALRRANGEVRGFLEIYQDLAALREKGVLSEANISELALALGGGGVRRAKDASALINSTERLNALAAETVNITGEDTIANDALGKKLETVQTANTRLANSFQELAQTLGDDGGLLDSFKSMINLLTGITQGADALFTALGRSGPTLATFATGLAAINAISEGRRATMIGRLGGSANYGASLTNDIAGIRSQGARGFGRGVLADILSMNARGGTIVGGAAVIGSAASNLQAGKNEQAIANVIGGLIGGAIGGTLSGGIGIAAGAAIGSSVADATVTGIMSHSQDLADFFARVQADGATRTGGGGYLPREATTEELIGLLYQTTGQGSQFLGGLGAKLGYGVSKVLPYGQDFASPEAAALEALRAKGQQDPEAQRLYLQIQRRFDEQTRQAGGIPTGTSDAQVQTNRQRIQDLQRLAEQERSRQLERVSTGELRPSEFGRISERLAGFPSAAFQGVDAFGDAFISLSKDIDNTAEAYNAFLELTVVGTDEQQQQISQYISDIQKLQSALEAMQAGGGLQTVDLTTGTSTFANIGEIQARLASVQQQAAQYTNASIINARLQRLQLPGIVGSATDATSSRDVELVRRQAEKLQQQFYTDMELTDEEVSHLRNGLEDFSVLVERAGEEHFETITGIDQKFWDAAQKLLVEQGKLAQQQGGIGFQKFDVPMSTLEALSQRSLRIGQGWQEKFNYDFKPEDQIAISREGIVQPLHADFKILALLLEKIVDQNQKQLDGQYNIPEGATFWVPLTAAYYRRSPGGESGLSDMLANLDFQENTTATDRNTGALDNLTNNLALLNEQRRGVAPEAAREKYLRGTDSLAMENERRRGAVPKAAYDKYYIENNLALQNERRRFQLPGATQAGNAFRGAATTAAVPAPSTRLDLRMSSNINLVVDGRVLANAMQTYLASELLRTEQSQGTITKRYVI